MPEKKKLYAAATVLLMVVLSAVAFFWFIGRGADDDADGRLSVYFFNAPEGRLEAEFRDLPQGEAIERINFTLGHFFSEPENANLSRVWPADAEFSELVTQIFIRDNMLVAMFSELYKELPPPEEALFRAAFTLTMVSLPYIDEILFRAGELEWLETGETIANAPFISPARRTSADFTLFFADESGEGLVATYEEIGVNIHTQIQDILERLIERQDGPGFFPLIPPETRVRDVLTEPDVGFYIDLSADFHIRFSGTPAQARMMLQSITHTVLENDGSNIPRRVFFLIDSERRDDFHGVSDFNLGFVVDESFMLGFIPPEPEYEE